MSPRPVPRRRKRAAWGPVVGPLFFYDLVRLARRGRSTLLRVSYVLGLLAALWLVYAQRFPRHHLFADPVARGPRVSLTEYGLLAGSFVAAILALQVAAALVLTPVYLASAVAEEKERRTLELLFTTPLSDREIVVGKLLSRLAHVGGVLLAGVPVMAVLQLWGGVDAGAILAGLAVTAATLLSVGSLSILWSATCRTVLSAVVGSYATVLFLLLFCPTPFTSPVAFLLDLEQQMGVRVVRHLLYGNGVRFGGSAGVAALGFGHMAVGYAAAHAGNALAALALAVRSLRRFGREHRPEVSRTGGRARLPAPVFGYGLPPSPQSRVRYPVTDQALLWKEVYHGADDRTGWTFRSGFYVGVASFLGFLVLQSIIRVVLGGPLLPVGREARWEMVHQAAQVFGAALGGLWCFWVALWSAGCVTREREQRTLTSLLALPVERRHVLAVKWVGGILRYRWVGFCLAGSWTAALLVGALHPLSMFLLAVALAVNLALLASVGVWISLASRSTLWANATMVIVLVVLALGWWTARGFGTVLLGTAPDERNWVARFIESGMNPLRTWLYLGLGWEDFGKEWGGGGGLAGPFGATVAGLALPAALAGVIWIAAALRFRREQA